MPRRMPMKMVRCAVFAAVNAALIAGCKSPVEPSAAKIRVSRTATDVGKVDVSADRLPVKVTLHNDGGQVLRIDNVTSFCGCAAISLPLANIEPGQASTFEVRLDRASPGKRTARVAVTCNDPARPALEIPFSWEACGRFEMSQESVNFGEIAPGSQKRAVVSLRQGGQPLQTTDPPTITCNPPELKCTLERGEDEYNLNLVLNATQALENRTGDVRVFVGASTVPECILPVRWEIRPELDASPRNLYLGKGAPGAKLVGQVVFSVSPAAKLDLSTLSLTTDDPDLHLSQSRLPDGAIQVEVTLQCPNKPGFVNRQLVARCTGAQERQLVVPVFAMLKGGRDEKTVSP